MAPAGRGEDECTPFSLDDKQLNFDTFRWDVDTLHPAKVMFLVIDTAVCEV